MSFPSLNGAVGTRTRARSPRTERVEIVGDFEMVCRATRRSGLRLAAESGRRSSDADLADRKLLTAKRDASARSGKPRQADKGRSRERRGRIGRLEFEMPGDRLGEARLGDAQHDRHRRIAGARAERDLEVQGVDIGQRDQAMCRAEIAEIERRVSARIPGQQVEVLLARPFDDRRYRG